MKYVFATALVIAALVMVFHADKIIPIPGAVYHWTIENGGRYLPFSTKVAYATACLDESRQARNDLRYKVSETAVRTADIEKESRNLDGERRARLQKIRFLSEHPDRTTPEDMERHVKAFRRANDQYVRLSNLQTQHVAAVRALAHAEEAASDKINELDDRLKLVQVEHLRHDALDMASADPDGQCKTGPGIPVRHGSKVITKLEFDERVREDLYNRFGTGASPDCQPESELDPFVNAQAVLTQYGHLIN